MFETVRCFIFSLSSSESEIDLGSWINAPVEKKKFTANDDDDYGEESKEKKIVFDYDQSKY